MSSSLHYESAPTPKVSKTTAAIILTVLTAAAGFAIHEGAKDNTHEATPHAAPAATDHPATSP